MQTMPPLNSIFLIICMFYHEYNGKSDLSEVRKSMKQDDPSVKSFMKHLQNDAFTELLIV